MQDQIRLEDLLIEDVEACTPRTPFDLLETRLARAPGGSLPVISDWILRRLVGQIDRRQVRQWLEQHGEPLDEVRIDDFVGEAHCCWLLDTPEAALATMCAYGVKVVHVVDVRDHLHGSVSWGRALRFSDPIARTLALETSGLTVEAAGRRTPHPQFAWKVVPTLTDSELTDEGDPTPAKSMSKGTAHRELGPSRCRAVRRPGRIRRLHEAL